MPSSSEPFRRRTFVASAMAAVVAACSTKSRGTATPTPTSSSTTEPTPTSLPPTFVSRGPRDRPQFALTFHVSGDRSLATGMLDLLGQHRVPVTAFMVGTFVEANPDIVRRFVDDGHELANHTYTHPTFPALSRSEMADEVTRCRDALARVAGNGGRFFRPSGTSDGTTDPGATVVEVARSAGYPTVIGFDVDPADYQDPGSSSITQRTIAALENGSIVSLHFGHAGTIDALPAILDAAASRMLTPVTMSTLLGI